MTAASIAGLCAVGVMLLMSGVYRLNQRLLTARRVSEVLGGESHRTYLPRQPSRWGLETRQVLAQIQAHHTSLRTPAIALAGGSALIRLATVSPPWLAPALLRAL